MGIMKGFTFDGEKSLDYDVYITGETVYNSPEREVESIVIAGRNGEFKLDKGRFGNIEVTYPAGTSDTNQADFADKMSDFRNFLASRKGYKRLEDDYHTDEFRLALFKEGFDVDPVSMGKAGEFDIVFDCQPQRFLKSGETEVTVTDGGTITNPTLFESKPLLEVKGYGNIEFNGFSIDIESGFFGNVVLTNAQNVYFGGSYDTNGSMYNSGDTITVSSLYLISIITPSSSSAIFTGTPTSSDSGDGTTNLTSGTRMITVTTSFNNLQFVTSSTTTKSHTVAVSATVNASGVTSTESISISYSIRYDSSTKKIRIFSPSIQYSIGGIVDATGSNPAGKMGEVTADSTKSYLGNPTYIDCEIGEAYRIESDETVGLNQYIDLGSELPVLASGANTVNFDNTITELKIIPRWWRI